MRIASLNVRGLRKQHLQNNNATGPPNFLTWLRHTDFDIMALQEINLPTTPTTTEQTNYNQYLNIHSSVWSSHCALLLRNPDLSLSNTTYAEEGRIIVTTVTSSSSSFEATFCVMYAPANKTARRLFMLNCLSLPFFLFPSLHTFLVGDLNYKHHAHPRPHPLFQDWVDTHLVDCITPPHTNPNPTHTQAGNKARNTIDYIFSSNHFLSQVAKSEQLCASPFSDHDMLLLTLSPASAPKTGRGIWRMNTQLLNNSDFIKELTDHLATFSSPRPHQSKTQHWDRVKMEIKRFCISASIKRKQDRQSAIQDLNIQRQTKLAQLQLATGATKDAITLDLEALESSLQQHTSEELDAYALRSGTLWREKGEGNTSYFFRAISQRAKKRLVPHLHNPATNTLTTSAEERLEVATGFYSHLYSCDPSDRDATNQLLDAIPPNAILSEQDNARLQGNVTSDEVEYVVGRTPLCKAPGKDGLPFELYRHILLIPWIMELFTAILNEALTYATFPASWQETVMILLFKKGDASKLANWRPLSLINSDAKLFTKILTLRIQPYMPLLTGSYQTGFTAGRHISDNGLVLTTLRDYCNAKKTKHVGILLDQEKAYDRVHLSRIKTS